MEKTYEQLKKKEKIVSIAGKALFFVVSLSVMMMILSLVSSF
ncbi:MAG TPA: hypothetical protein VLH59_04920 [Ignavibacteriaceae bacterium]|nr:hypothetical protein [Ignavibacteriaceae bacterium]